MKDVMLLIALLITQAGIQISIAQFPTVCMKPESPDPKECCPPYVYNGSKCGSEDGRGRCESITLPEEMSSVRDAWPYYFNRVCICNNNFAGYDCGRCKYGHYGVNCNSSKVVDRRPISEYSQREWEDYVKILSLTKKHLSGYSVFLEEPSASSDPSQLPRSDNITLYNLFVWQHHYSAKDSDALKKDYAHESTGFPTWHRQFLLWFEWEVQYMLKNMMEDDYYMFRIPYWDWRKEKQTDDNSPFKSNRLGETVVNRNGLPQVHGGDFLNNWQTVCWRKDGENPDTDICNPQVVTGQLQRCPLKESCGSENELWPTDNDVQTVLSLQEYDTFPYNSKAANSFRNELEGFKPLFPDDIEFCRENKLCACKLGGSDDFNCTESADGPQPTDPIQRLLHNSVHIILGLGYFGSDAQTNKSIMGVMADVASSANDPIFLNHHAMVDCIFESWLQKNPNAQYPVNDDIPRGHRKHDYIVPFFPLFMHGDMFSAAEKFGYRCTLQSNKSLPSWAIILILVGVIIVVAIVVGPIICVVVRVCVKKKVCNCKCSKRGRNGYGAVPEIDYGSTSVDSNKAAFLRGQQS